MKKKLLIPVFIILFATWTSSSAQVVTTNSDVVAGSLRQVISSASPGATITFASNVTSTILLTAGELFINKNLTIIGLGNAPVMG